MSTSLPPHGRVIVDTTVGEIEIELWAKETPRACRNFLALAMEGYYDGVIFHRVVPGFLVQTGDKTGTGAGGESFYGEPFEDEIHPRLRFAHRGIVAMANNGDKNSNDSQFIITLDRAEELHGKHTLFGRVVGDTIYNVMKIGELELKDERPVYPPKIKRIRIIDNPFDDIIPRITAAEKRAQQMAREQGQKEREEAARRKGAKKNVKLLSFVGDEEEAAEESEPVTFTKKALVRPDLVEAPQPKPSAPSAPGPSERRSKSTAAPLSSSKRADDIDITKIREKHAEEQGAGERARKSEIQKMETEIRKLTRRRDDGDDSDDEPTSKKPKRSYLEEGLAKYSKGKKKAGEKKRGEEDDVLAALNSFQKTLKEKQAQYTADEDMEAPPAPVGENGEIEEDPGIEVDEWDGFLGHKLTFAKDDGSETIKAQRDYEVIDPRARGAKAKEEDQASKKRTKQQRLIAKRT